METQFWITAACIIGLYTSYELGVSQLIRMRNRRRVHMVDRIHKIIGMPLKTQVRAIVRHKMSWVVWTGVNDMQLPYYKWTGTYLQLIDNGTALHVTVQPDGVEDTRRIM